jgi:hypothetical protein
MSSMPHAAVSLRAILAAAARQRDALITRDREAMRTEDEALGALLIGLQASTCGGIDEEVSGLAREARERVQINAALAANGQVIVEHLARALATARPGGGPGVVDARR